MAVIGRIILCSFLTCFVQCIAVAVRPRPHSSDRIMTQGVSVALSLVLLFFRMGGICKNVSLPGKGKNGSKAGSFQPWENRLLCTASGQDGRRK